MRKIKVFTILLLIQCISCKDYKKGNEELRKTDIELYKILVIRPDNKTYEKYKNHADQPYNGVLFLCKARANYDKLICIDKNIFINKRDTIYLNNVNSFDKCQQLKKDSTSYNFIFTSDTRFLSEKEFINRFGSVGKDTLYFIDSLSNFTVIKKTKTFKIDTLNEVSADEIYKYMRFEKSNQNK